MGLNCSTYWVKRVHKTSQVTVAIKNLLVLKLGLILRFKASLRSVYLQLLNTPSPSNPHILCAGNQRRGTLSFTRMQFFLVAIINFVFDQICAVIPIGIDSI